MSTSDRAAAAEPYVRRVLDDREVQDAFRRAASAGRDTYLRARGKSPGKAVKDKRLRRRARRAAIASWQLVTAIDAAYSDRKPRRGRRAMFVLALIAGTYGAYLVSNAKGRAAVRGLIARRDASSQSSNAQ
jgi:hypothetical protein